MSAPIIHWFRRDLRLRDNPGLVAAGDRPVVGVWIDEGQGAGQTSSRAARWRLWQGIEALSVDLVHAGVPFLKAWGTPLPVLLSIARTLCTRTIHATGIPEPAAQAEEAALKAACSREGLELVIHEAALLFPPRADPTGDQRFRRTWSGFARAARSAMGRIAPPAGEAQLRPFTLAAATDFPDITPLGARDLYRGTPDWAAGFDAADCGEAAARARWQRFLASGLAGYAARRDSMDGEGGSGLSAHLQAGEISVHRIWADLAAISDAPDLMARPGLQAGAEKFASELLWREFAHHVLAQFPDLATAPLQPDFNRFPWREAPAELDAWRHGKTGYPIVDALMRCLWRTGRMSNRGRMIVASFLCKHLLIDWRQGQAWFEDCLVDYSPATNPFSWQWVAGCGTDAAPFFRIFNPVLQGEKFDPEGRFIRTFVPELAALPASYIHQPWTAPAGDLIIAGITGGKDYPLPIVDHVFARKRALDAFGRLRASGT